MYELQPETKSNGCLKVFAVIGVLAVVVGGVFLAMIVFAFSSTSATSDSSHSERTAHNVVYKATTSRLKYGDCFGFDATYEMPSGTAQQGGGVCSGSKSIVVDTRTGYPGDFVYLSIQNDEWSAKIGCEIYVDGKLVYQTHSQGQYVIASCSGSIP